MWGLIKVKKRHHVSWKTDWRDPKHRKLTPRFLPVLPSASSLTVRAAPAPSGALPGKAQVPPKFKADVSHWERRHFRLSCPWSWAGLSAPRLLPILTAPREASREGCRSPPIPAGPQRLGASFAISSGLPPKR